MRPDNWERSHNRGRHFSGEEMAEIKRSYLAGESYRDTAQRLRCTSRIIMKHFALLKDEGFKPQDAAPIKSRFYKTNFEL